MLRLVEKSPTRKRKEERLDWLANQLELVQTDLTSAREDTSWTAVMNLHKEARNYRTEIDKLEIELAAEEEADLAAQQKDLTPEQWMERLEEDARAATVDELEPYVAEWLRRKRYRLTLDDGELGLERLET